jgi:hypothetical protein
VSSSSKREPPDEATVAAYLSNRLDGMSAEAFEAYCLRHPDFARQVELDLFLKVGLRQMQGPDAVRRAIQRRRIVLAIAASVILGVGCGLLLPARHPATRVAYASANEVPSQLLSGPRVGATLIRLRDGASVHRIVASRGVSLLVLRIAADAAPGRLGYAISVAPEPGVSLGSMTLDRLHADADGYLRIYLPLAALVGQTFRLTVASSPPEGTDALSFRLQVAYADNTPADSLPIR